MVFDVVQLENNETFLQQVEIFSRVEQVIELTTLVIWPEYIKEIVYIKILLLHLISFQYRHIFIPQELVKGIKAGEYFGMLFKICIVAAYCVRQCHILRTLELLIVFFPERQQQGFDAFLFLRIQRIALTDIKRVEPDWVFFRISEVITVHHLAEADVAMADIHQHDMCALFVVAAYHMVGEETFAAAGRAEYEFVAVGADTFVYRLISYVHMYGLTCQAVTHPDTNGA